MAEIKISAASDDIYEEVNKTTSFLGVKNKLDNGKSAYDQVFTTVADKAILERFLNESREILIGLFKRFLTNVDYAAAEMCFTLDMPSNFKDELQDSMEQSMGHFATNYIIAKWCEITCPEKAKEYADNAAQQLKDIKDKLYYKKPPTRTEITKS